MPWFVRTREGAVTWWHDARHQSWTDDIQVATAYAQEAAARAAADRLSAARRHNRGYRIAEDPHQVWRMRDAGDLS